MAVLLCYCECKVDGKRYVVCVTAAPIIIILIYFRIISHSQMQRFGLKTLCKEASELNYVNSITNIMGINFLRLRGTHMLSHFSNHSMFVNDCSLETFDRINNYYTKVCLTFTSQRLIPNTYLKLNGLNLQWKSRNLLNIPP